MVGFCGLRLAPDHWVYLPMAVNIRYKIYSVQTRIEGDNGAVFAPIARLWPSWRCLYQVGIMLSCSAVTRMNVLQCVVSCQAQDQARLTALRHIHGHLSSAVKLVV